MNSSITVAAYAKINLTLDVGARRADGYHEIRSVMQTIGLHDTLTVTRTPETPGVRLEVCGDEAAGVPADASNLVHRAAVRLQKIAAARGEHSRQRVGPAHSAGKAHPVAGGTGRGQQRRGGHAAGGQHSVRPAALAAAADGAGDGVGRGRAVLSDRRDGTGGGPGGAGDADAAAHPRPGRWSSSSRRSASRRAWAYGALDALPGRAPGAATAAWLQGGGKFANDFEAVALRRRRSGMPGGCFRTRRSGQRERRRCCAGAGRRCSAGFRTLRPRSVWRSESGGRGSARRG